MSHKPLSQSHRTLLSEYLRNSPKRGVAQSSTIPRSYGVGPVPLSFGQRLIWLHCQTSPPSVPLYNEPWTVHFHGPIDVLALQKAIQEFIQRHEAWRTAFTVFDNEPVQVVRPDPLFEFQVSDLRALPSGCRESEANRVAQADARRPFDLASGLLVRTRLVTLSDEYHRLYLTLHHIIFDGFAIYRVFLPELASLYDAFAEGKPSALPDVPLQYRDYANWQNERWRTGELDGHERYWLEQLAREQPLLNLPTTGTRSPLQDFRGDMCPIAIAGDTRDALKQFGAENGASLFMVLLAAFEALLYRYSGQRDFLVGTVTAGRNHPDLHNLVGYCLNNVPLRVDFSGRPTFIEVLRRVRNDTLNALAHDEVAFDVLVRQLRPKRTPGRTPLFDVMFSMEPPLANVDQRWNLTQVEVASGASKFELDFELDERQDGITGKLAYRTALFSRELAQAYVADYCAILRAVVANPGISADDLPGGNVGPSLPVRAVSSAPSIMPAALNKGSPEKDDIETRVLKLWRSVLSDVEVGAHEDFFDVGGHSFSAVQLLALTRSEFGISIDVADFLQCPTVAGFAATIRQKLSKVPQQNCSAEAPTSSRVSQ